MSARERMLAAFRGEDVDRFPVWLKMANPTWQSSQPEPYRSLPAFELLTRAGCDVMVGCGVPVDTVAPHGQRSASEENGVRTISIETPDGVLVGEERFDPGTRSWHPRSYLAENAADLRRLRWLFRDTRYTVDPAQSEKAAQEQKKLAAKGAVTNAGIGPGPLMNLMQLLCGPEAAIFLMYDEPELFGEVLELMHQDRLRQLRAQLPHVAADTFWLTENTSTSLISPAMFAEFCLPHLTDYGNLILAHGLIPVHHMCGELNALLEMIDKLPARANEAYTTPPLGNTTLAEGRRRMPSKALIGGTNATLWLEPAEKIVETVAKDLEACPDRRRIFLTSAGVLPPSVSFEKAKAVVAAFKEL